LTLDLADMRLRYATLRDEWRGSVPMGRLLESAKLLYAAGQPYLRTTTLRAVAEQIRGDGRMSADLWEMLQRRTQEEGFGQFDVGSGLFQTYRPYLEDCVLRKHMLHRSLS
jgi:hypothetical protein